MGSKAKVVAAGAGTVAAAMAVLLPWLKRDEGLSLKAYEDVASVWTGCYGHAYVQPGMTWTKEQCEAILETDATAFLLPVTAQIKVPVSPRTLAAHAHFAFNIGLEGYKKSLTLKYTNAGDPASGCRAMMNWTTAGGKDCRVKANRCYGLVTRRAEEVSTCLAGLQ